MKDMVYRIVVDTWRLAAKYGFQRLDDRAWEEFIRDEQKLAGRHRVEGCAAERLCRDLFYAFSSFYESLNDVGRSQEGGKHAGNRNCSRHGIQKPER